MKRSEFIKTSLGASLGVVTLGQSTFGMSARRRDNVCASISRVNDRRVEAVLNSGQQSGRSGGHRGQSGLILALSAAYCSEYSDFYQSQDLVAPMQTASETLLRNQNPDGTFDSGNLQSPPDSGFTIEQLFRAQALLEKHATARTAALRQSIKEIMLNTCEALVTGGVHTPNHRWAISAALAGTYNLYPDARYLRRINDWLGEGIGQDADGEHPERSRNYDAAVNNPSLLDVAIYTNRPEILDYVRKNLEMTLYLLELNGEVDTVASRRQDQGRSIMIHRYYLPYRYLAIKDQNPRFAEIAKVIEATYMDTLGEHLSDFLLHPELNNALPASEPLSDNYVKHLRETKLVRIRRGNKTAAIFGGTDWHLGNGVWSGISHNPTFFKFRKGDAILESVRMSPAFFRTGYFRSNGLNATGGEYHLEEVRQVPYHLPLPEEFRNEAGDYKLSPDGRFFSKMDFENRPKQYKTLRSRVTVKESSNDGVFELDISVDETPKVPVAIELCFRKGGQLNGTSPRQNDTDGYFLSEGNGIYRVGNDVIEFGPGLMEHTGATQANEQYSVHNGGIRVEGYRVYITGITPFRHRLIIS